MLPPATLCAGSASLYDGVGHEAHQAVPLDRRVAARRGDVEQLAVLDEQEALDHQRRNRGEVGEDALRLTAGEDHLAGVVQDGQAGLGLLAEDRERAAVDQPAMRLREAGLLGDRKAPGRRALDQGRQIDVAEAAVVGAVGGEADAGARPWLEGEGQLAGQPAEQLGL